MLYGINLKVVKPVNKPEFNPFIDFSLDYDLLPRKFVLSLFVCLFISFRVLGR